MPLANESLGNILWPPSMVTVSTMKAALAFAAASSCLAALLASPASWAQDSDEWKFQAVLYVYLPSVGGETTFPSSGGGDGASVDSSKILDNLNSAFMGSFEADKGPWGISTDLIYLDIGDSQSPSRAFSIGGTLPVGATANIRYGIEGWLWTLAGTWRVMSEPGYDLTLIGGARLIDIHQTINWDLTGNIGSIALPDRSGERRTGVENWDAIVGLKGRAMFGEKRRWFASYYFDIGTGESSLTWQAMAGGGYSFGWGDVILAWRHIDYDMKPGKTIESVNFDGPGIAAAFRW
jgi:hypothetical protein